VRQECQLTPIARGRGCRVDCCEHGIVHVTIGDVTLRIPKSGLGALADTLAAAQSELRFRPPIERRRTC
jgi:hypothetical protein